MSKQKFQIGDKVCVKRGNKNEIGRVGNVINIVNKFGALPPIYTKKEIEK